MDSVEVIVFSKPGCQPCRQIAPIIAAYAEDNPDVIIMEIDIMEQPEVIEQYDLLGAPTVVLLDEGVEIVRKTGVMAASLFQ